MRTPVVTFLSDYGLDDEFVGVCHSVIATICPTAKVIDITHGIPRHDVRSGALALAAALPYAPPGVHLAVVDPEVGADRRAVALRCGDRERILVGPDNGLLWLAAQRFGGIVDAVDVGRSPWRLEPVSATFHGRDVFAPVAAQLAAGETLALGGEPLDIDQVRRLELLRARPSDGALIAHVLTADRFGNAVLDATHEDLEGTGLRLGQPVLIVTSDRRLPATYAVTFADVAPGDTLVYEDATRRLAVAVNRGNAIELLGLLPDEELRLEPA